MSTPSGRGHYNTVTLLTITAAMFAFIMYTVFVAGISLCIKLGMPSNLDTHCVIFDGS